MNDDLVNDVNFVLQQVYSQDSEAHDQEPDEEEDVIHVHHFPDARLIELPDGTIIFKKSGSTTTNIPVVDSTPKATEVNQAPMLLAYLTVGIFIVLMLSSILFQLYVIFHPPIATITIIPKSQQMTLSGTLQIGRVLSPITLSQTETVPTTGHGHQDARQATGSITFYNGSFSSQTVYAGTVLIGADGVQVVTDETVTVPPNNPPQDGQASIAAHAINAGSTGNIQAFDINGTFSSTLYVKNLAAFTGGQDERNFQTVTQADIDNAATPMQATLSASMQGALQGELKNNEALLTNSCRPTVAPDHHPGTEATQVKVTVSETCSAVAYNEKTLQAQVTALLSQQVAKTLGTGYSLLGTPQINVTQAGAQNTKVVVSFSSSGTWVYALANKEQEYIKKIIAGKTKEKALQLLSSLPDIERVSMQWSDDTKLPKNPNNIHLILMYGV